MEQAEAVKNATAQANKIRQAQQDEAKNYWERLRPELYEEIKSLDILETVTVAKTRNYTYRVYPGPEERTAMHKTFGCARQYWNILTDNLHAYLVSISFESGEIPSDFTKHLAKVSEVRKAFPYMKEIDSLALANVRLDFIKAVRAYNKAHANDKSPQYRKKARKRVKNGGEPLTFRDLKGMPKFHAKFYCKDSYHTNNHVDKETIRIEPTANKRFAMLHIPKMDTDVKIRYHRPLPENAVIKGATLERTHVDVYEATVSFEHEETTVRPKTDAETIEKIKTFFEAHAEELCLGLDYDQELGCYPSEKELLGEISGGFQHRYKALEDKIAALQRKLAKKQGPDHEKGIEASGKYRKLQAKISKMQWRLANARLDDLYKLASRLAKKFYLIAVEDINLVVMMQALRLAKNLQDNSFGKLREILAYKLDDQGKFFVKIDRWYPSTQICHNCGARNTGIRGLKNLHKETWVCEHCGAEHHRDYNAALNIRDEGIRSVAPPKEKKPSFAKTFCKPGQKKKAANISRPEDRTAAVVGMPAALPQ